MAKKYTWPALFRPNALTPDNDRDQLADVVQAGPTKHDADVVDAIVAGGIEVNRSTIADIIDRRNKAVMEFALSGCNYSNEVEQFTPRIAGVFEDINAQFDPALHKCVVDISMGSALRAGLASVGVRIQGVKDSGGAKIGAVTNSLTGEKDGTVPIGDDAILEGEKLKVLDEKDAEQGVFIIDAAGTEHRVARHLSVNKPSQVIARIPDDVPAGDVSIVIRTRYSASALPLKAVREIRYAYSCRAVAAE